MKMSQQDPKGSRFESGSGDHTFAPVLGDSEKEFQLGHAGQTKLTKFI